MFSYSVQRAEAAATVREYVKHCVDVPRFLDCCRQCPNYGARWSCPPFAFDPMEVWGRFQTIRLFARFYLPGNRDGEALIQVLEGEKPRFMDELLELERANPGSLALACGSCERCQACTRGQGAPCAYPQWMRRSIESLGGDVTETASRYFGKPLLWVQDGVAPDYLMLVGGLLLRE